jgi:hypothetical protein
MRRYSIKFRFQNTCEARYIYNASALDSAHGGGDRLQIDPVPFLLKIQANEPMSGFRG